MKKGGPVRDMTCQFAHGLVQYDQISETKRGMRR